MAAGRRRTEVRQEIAARLGRVAHKPQKNMQERWGDSDGAHSASDENENCSDEEQQEQGLQMAPRKHNSKDHKEQSLL